MGHRGGRTITAHSPSGSSRLIWVDVARGALIVLVVLYHVVAVHLATSATRSPGPTADVLEGVVVALRPLRMPLFFLVSGFLASRTITRPWRRVARERVLLFGYVYLVWLVIQTGVLLAIGDPELMIRFGGSPYSTEEPWNPLLGILANATFSPTSVWFLFALAIYVPVAKLLSRARVPALAIAIILYLVSAEGWDTPGLGQLPFVAAYLFFFLLGAYCPELIRQVAARPRGIPIVLAGVAFIVPQAAEMLLADRIPALLLIESFGGAYIGITLAVCIATRLPRVRTALSYLGRRTLAIYVIHMPVLWIIHALTAHPGWTLARVDSGMALIVYASGALSVTLVVSLIIATALGRWAPWLFAVPAKRARHRAMRGHNPTTKTRVSEFDFDDLGVVPRLRESVRASLEVQHALRSEATAHRVDEGGEVASSPLPAPQPLRAGE